VAAVGLLIWGGNVPGGTLGYLKGPNSGRDLDLT